MKIVALNGLLGYGYSEEALNIAFSEKVDYIGVDAGSTDPGPYYLGSGNFDCFAMPSLHFRDGCHICKPA